MSKKKKKSNNVKSKSDFEIQCLEVARAMFGKSYSDLSDDEASIVSSEVKHRNQINPMKDITRWFLR